MNILLVCPGDVRHVLKTVAQRFRHASPAAARRLHFFVFDRPAEALERHALLLSVAADWALPVK